MDDRTGATCPICGADFPHRHEWPWQARETPSATAASGEKSCIHRHDIGFDKWISYQPFVEIGKPNADKETLYTPSQMRAAWEAGATSRDKPSTAAPRSPSELVDEIVKDIRGRKGLGDTWDAIDEDIREEIVAEWRALLSATATTGEKT